MKLNVSAIVISCAVELQGFFYLQLLPLLNRATRAPKLSVWHSQKSAINA